MATNYDCTEPDGQERVSIRGGTISAHTAAMREIGHCPWCGANDDDEAFEDTRRGPNGATRFDAFEAHGLTPQAGEMGTDYEHPMVPGYGDRL